MTDVLDLTLHEQAELIRTGALSSVELVAETFARIHSSQALNAYLTLCEEAAIEQARAADVCIREGEGGPLTGLPIALKDNMCVRGVKMTCASRILERYVPPYDATVVSRLKEAGAVLPGKTNLDEFAMGSSTENSAFGPTRNPWSLDRTPGGSSGGSAVATAAGLASAALGSDTGGSIRQPAGLTGIVGLKPTYGRVSRYGLAAFASSLDQIGPFGRDVQDVAMLLQTIAGADPRDATSDPVAVPDYRAELEAGVAGIRIGLPEEYFGDGADPEVREALEGAIRLYEKLGASIRPVRMPHASYAIAVYYVVAPAEASSNLSRYDGIRFGSRQAASSLSELYTRTRTQGFGAEVQRRIMLGTFVLSAGYYDAYYGRALDVRQRIRADFQQAFEACDVLLTPTSPTPAFRFGEKEDPLSMYLADIYTVSANLAGVPGLSLPAGFSSGGLPIGMQLMGPWFSEARLLQVARAYERETDWHQRRPPHRRDVSLLAKG